MKNKFILFLLLIINLSIFSQDNKQLLNEAENFFKLAQQNSSEKEVYLEKSLSSYLMILNSCNNYAINYNIGNIYFLLENYPNALYYYKTASKRNNSSEVKKSIALTQNLLKESLNESNYDKILKSIFFYHFYFSSILKKVLLVITFLVLLLLILLKLFIGKKWVLNSIYVILALFIFNLPFVIVSEIEKKVLVEGIILNETYGKNGDGNFYDNYFDKAIPLGSICRVLDNRGDWIKIKLISGQSCWVEKNSISLIK